MKVPKAPGRNRST